MCIIREKTVNIATPQQRVTAAQHRKDEQWCKNNLILYVIDVFHLLEQTILFYHPRHVCPLIYTKFTSLSPTGCLLPLHWRQTGSDGTIFDLGSSACLQTNKNIMDNQDFKEGDIVCLETGTKGKIISIEKPLGTYCIYIVQSLHDGTVERKARHQPI